MVHGSGCLLWFGVWYHIPTGADATLCKGSPGVIRGSDKLPTLFLGVH